MCSQYSSGFKNIYYLAKFNISNHRECIVLTAQRRECDDMGLHECKRFWHPPCRRGSRSKSKRYLPCVMALTGTACVSLVALKCAYLFTFNLFTFDSFTFDLFTFNSFTFDLTAFSNSKNFTTSLRIQRLPIHSIKTKQRQIP